MLVLFLDISVFYWRLSGNNNITITSNKSRYEASHDMWIYLVGNILSIDAVMVDPTSQKHKIETQKRHWLSNIIKELLSLCSI